MKESMKTFLEFVAGVSALPSLLAYRFYRELLGADRACEVVSQRASKWTGICGEYRRRILYKKILLKMGDGVVIAFGSCLSKPTVELGHRVYIGAYSMLGDVVVGDDTLIADHVCIPSGAHQHGFSRLDIPIREQAGLSRTMHIGCDSWIGSGAIILADVGDHCIVGAGSVVTHPVEDYKIVAGNPARVIGDRREKAAV